jgi:hypothetical protein
LVVEKHEVGECEGGFRGLLELRREGGREGGREDEREGARERLRRSKSCDRSQQRVHSRIETEQARTHDQRR